MRFLKLISFFVLTFFAPLFVFAQVETTPADQSSVLTDQINKLVEERTSAIPTPEQIKSNALRDYLDVKTIPQNPAPGATVRISITSYLTDLSRATIAWMVNGKTIDRGTGKTSFSFQNGASGETTRLTINITTSDDEHITKELSFRPAGITILWEADTYTPPFYRGKALLTPQARVRAIAIPDSSGTRSALDAGSLVYVWKKDGTAVSEASGYGKNSYSFMGPKPFGDANVKVAVSSVDNVIKSEMEVKLPLVNPFILFYENHPLLGTWYGRTLGTDLTLTKKEFSINAEPYFFSNEVGEAPTLLYNWSLNGKGVQNVGRAITLRNETGEKGSSSLALAMRGLKQTFQTAGQSLLINFTPEEAARPTF